MTNGMRRTATHLECFTCLDVQHAELRASLVLVEASQIGKDRGVATSAVGPLAAHRAVEGKDA